jgi:hypothetical protein
VSSNQDGWSGCFIASLKGRQNRTYIYEDGSHLDPHGLQIIAVEGKNVEFERKNVVR